MSTLKYDREQPLGYYKLHNIMNTKDVSDKIYTLYDIDLLLMKAPDWSDEFAQKAKEELEK